MPNGNALAAATQRYGALPPGGVWVDQAGPGSAYYPMHILDFDGMSTQDYLANYKGRIKFAKDAHRFDVRVIHAGGTVAAGEQDFFVNEKGKSEKSLDGATTITKTDYYTNMEAPRQMEKGTALLVDSIQIEIFQTTREYNAFTSNTDEPSDFTAAVAADTKPASNILAGIQRTMRVELWRGNELLGAGRLCDFPNEGGFSGILGGPTNEGIIQNGFGFPRRLREVCVLGENYLFTLKTFWERAVVCPNNVEIRAKLCGLEFRSVGGI